MSENETTGSANEHGLTEIPVTPPPNFAELINYPGAARYVALYYVGTNATWDDGLASASFSYFGVYSPMLEHPVLAIHLLDADLGSDDGPPTHALVCDREGDKFLLGGYDDALRFVRSQISDEEREEAGRRFAALFEGAGALEEFSPEDFRRVGMFEFLIAPSAEARQDTAAMLNHLDLQITEGLVRRYVEMSKKGDALRAFGPLRYLHALFERARGQQGSAA